MRNDLEQLMRQKVPFTDDPAKAFEEANKHRSSGGQKEGSQGKRQQTL